MAAPLGEGDKSAAKIMDKRRDYKKDWYYEKNSFNSPHISNVN